jgi:hypothetical protein
MEAKEYTVEEIEQKTKELQQEAIRIGFYILKCDAQKTPVTADDYDHQDIIVKQYKFFKSMLAEMRKEQKAESGSGGLSALFKKIESVDLGVKAIQQKIS